MEESQDIKITIIDRDGVSHNIDAPTVESYKFLVKGKLIRNCPITIEDIKIENDTWGKGIIYVKGKSTRSRPTLV